MSDGFDKHPLNMPTITYSEYIKDMLTTLPKNEMEKLGLPTMKFFDISNKGEK